MEQLEILKDKGWSYYIGYSQTYKGYLCRIWAQREQPIKMRTIGGADVIIFTECYSAVEKSSAEAIQKALEEQKLGLHHWWYGVNDEQNK